jgi:putative PIN family toxin of toxin-antitoxin system
MRIVLDTNVLVSGLLNPDGLPVQILNLILNGKITILFDNRIINEYTEVLKRKLFGFKDEWIEPLLDFIKSEGEFITAEPVKLEFKDEDDKVFYEVAKSGKAKYLITGNIAHFPREKFIVSPKDFIAIEFK